MAKPQPYDPHNTEQEDVVKVQDRLREFFKPLEECPLLDGVYLEGIVTETAPTDTIVQHGLGRTPIGWIICDRSTTGLLRRVSWDEKELVLLASAQFTISLWVF